MLKRVVVGSGVVGTVGAVAVSAYAQGTGTVDLSDVTLDTASVLALAAIVLTAIGAIWGIKKLIKLANRS